MNTRIHSHLIKQFCFALNGKQEFISQHWDYQKETILKKYSLLSVLPRPGDQPYLGEKTFSSEWTRKTHVQRQQGWQMSAMPLPIKDCFVFIPFETRSNMTHVLPQLCLRARGPLPGVIWKLLHSKVTQGDLKYLCTVKQYMDIYSLFQNICI